MDPISILLVEDEDFDAELIAHALRKAGVAFTCIRVQTEPEFLQALESHPDVVLADYNLPQFNGMDALRLLRDRHPDIPFILISGTIGDEDAVAAIREGADDYLIKDRLGRLGEAITGAIERLRLRAEKRHTEEKLRQLSTRLLKLQDEERRRISRDLHDSTAQKLSALGLNLGRLSYLLEHMNGDVARIIEESNQLTEDALHEIRDLSYLLHPPMLDEAGLETALRWYIGGFSQRSRIHATLEMDEGIGRLAVDVETAFFRIIQESLTNILRHSGGTRAAIRLSLSDEGLSLEIEDDGKGFTPARPDAPAKLGVGITGMHERLRQLGGVLEIKSGTKGTTVRAFLPRERIYDESHPDINS
jgi:signal transduction histidine kinase